MFLLFIVLQNYFLGLHGGAVAAVAEAISIACARTVVAEDTEIFLGELSMSYLSGAPLNVSLTFALGSLSCLYILMEGMKQKSL